MGRLSRYTQLLFGSTAGANQIAQFGSFAAGSPNRYSGTSVTPTLIQGLANYLGGWGAAIVGNASPAWQDRNAIDYLFAFQLCYLMQQGIPEWDSGTTYYAGSLVQSAGTVFVSLTNTNLNNALTNPTYWAQPTDNGETTALTAPASTTVATGNCMSWPYLTIPTATNFIVSTGAVLAGVGYINLTGTANLTLQGTAICIIK